MFIDKLCSFRLNMKSIGSVRFLKPRSSDGSSNLPDSTFFLVRKECKGNGVAEAVTPSPNLQ